MTPFDTAPVAIYQIVEQTPSSSLCMPYDLRPMEGYVKPGEKIVLHGGIAIGNNTENETIFIREEFRLTQGGYHVSIFDAATGQSLIVDQQSPMNAAYFYIRNEGKPALEKLEHNFGRLLAQK